MAEDKKVAALVDERKYAILTKESVRMMAESAGHAEVPDAVTSILGEDVSYRLREITQKSAQFMRHAKRRQMNTDDFNKACHISDVQPVYGHGSPEVPSPFRQTRDGDFHFIEDPETNLTAAAFAPYTPKNQGDISIKAHWLVVEGVQKSAAAIGEKPSTKPEVSATLLKYFDRITQAILGFDEEMMKTALVDIRTNSNITPLIPHFVSFVSNGVKVVSYDARQLTKLLHTVRSLVSNMSLFLEPQPYLVHLIQSVQFCLLEPLAASINPRNDQWSLRDYAARILSLIIRVWDNPVNHLQRFTEKTLREVLYDHSKPFCCHYGAVMGLLSLGAENIERVLLPHMSTYWPHLMAAMETVGPDTTALKADAHKVHGVILLCVEFILRTRITEFKKKYMSESEAKPDAVWNKGKQSSTSGFISMFDKSPSAFYNEMFDYFGDSLCMRLPDIPELKYTVFKPTPKEVNVSLEDPESRKTGEELLSELMEQVKQQEEMDRRRREQERFEQEKREREKQARMERKQIEYVNRMADYHQQLGLAQQRKLQQTLIDSDEEIDVEGDKSDNSNHSEEDSVGLAVKSTVSGPGQGIKLTITKRPHLKLHMRSGDEHSPSPHGDGREKKSRKRKQVHSPKPFDAFEFEDISDYEATPPSFTSRAIYSSEGEASSDGGSGRKLALTMKFKKKDQPSE